VQANRGVWASVPGGFVVVAFYEPEVEVGPAECLVNTVDESARKPVAIVADVDDDVGPAFLGVGDGALGVSGIAMPVSGERDPTRVVHRELPNAE
jgi:hypothetical protein